MTCRCRVWVFALLAALMWGCGSDPTVYWDNGPQEAGGSAGASSTGVGGRGDPGLGFGGDGTGGRSQVAVCGNGEREPGEFCDDGGEEDGDGCSANCLEQDPDFVCLTPGEPCERVVTCGNGVLEGTEACDDDNTNDDDGCAADCSEVEEGWDCSRPGKPCVELPDCGNGLYERGEACDDGNDESGDGCTGTEDPLLLGCQLEEGYWCPTPGDDCVSLECGDGNRTPEEECDDGNASSDDGCSDQCEVEEGWQCSTSGCKPICSDGIIVGNEACDDGNRRSGDGCSGACVEEPYYDCTGEPSDCSSTIECGNGDVEPGERCEPPNENGCSRDCRDIAPDIATDAVCGNGVIELGEQCDSTDELPGCTDCTVDPGYECPRPGFCRPLPACGDGIVQAGEACDDGNTAANDGCSGCVVTEGWSCYGLQPSICEQPLCGDGVLSVGEECDDGNLNEGLASDETDGCSTSCELDEGWTCPEADEECIPTCGDGALNGDEECDDNNRTNDDGCNAACTLEPGFVCTETDDGSSCEPTVCGNDVEEPGEGCDDNNAIAGDGCGPTCQNEPTVTVGPSPVVNVTCGDGMVTSGEACDDGNVTPGDGCSATCTVEAGYRCDDRIDYAPFVEFAVTYRDFMRRDTDNNDYSDGTPEDGGHPDFEWWTNSRMVPNMPGPVCTTQTPDACAAAPGALCGANSCGVLDAEGKPIYHYAAPTSEDEADQHGLVTSPDTYALWYRNENAPAVEGIGGVIQMCHVNSSLQLAQVGGATSDVYEYDSSSHFPIGDEEEGIDEECFGNISTTARVDGSWTQVHRNYHFTTELRYFFQYRGGETLTFRGDDDVWVFINGRLAVDIGGVHERLWGRVVLGDDGNGAAEDSDCSLHGVASTTTPGVCDLEDDERDDLDDTRFGLTPGGVYEIVLFHAERHTSDSNFKLTLAGFLAPRSDCEEICGDGIVVGREVCDDGTYDADDEDHDDPGEYNSDTVYGACNTRCDMRTFCGDRVTQGEDDTPAGPEECDNGRNIDLYSTGAEGECAPGCVLPPRCGDGDVQAPIEECDNGDDNTNDAYGLTECQENCTLGGYCGDGIENGPEECDLGPDNGRTYGDDSCGYDCLPGPRCGDGIINGSEQCDGDTETVSCEPNCTVTPYCGDGLTGNGEECDYGAFATEDPYDYGGCTTTCDWAARCGDGNLDEEFEECDEGDASNLGGYDGCTSTCMKGPHCGDGIRQSDEGEACDNGFNDDVYAYNSDSCGPGCTMPPHCGDGDVAPSFELCDEGEDNDDNTYNGCTTSCVWGPYCGDGDVAPEEDCDEGTNNTFYSADGEGCGPDCKPAPYCGDGIRNGPEQCDDGTDDNTGEYGGCNEDCTRAPYCGDGIRQPEHGEECDDGVIGSLSCSPQCERRIVAY